MAYGAGMQRLNPCEDALVLGLLRKFCPAPDAVLDAGCGRGDRLAALSEALPETALYGLDADGENAAAARQRCPTAEIAAAGMEAIPWAPAKFDGALCECALSLTDAPERCLRELGRVLRPGGVLLLGDLCLPDSGEPVMLPGNGTVRRLFSRSWLEAAADAAGFSLLQYADCREALVTMAAQMILDGSFCRCLDGGAAAALRQYRAGYGLWIFEKR